MVKDVSSHLIGTAKKVITLAEEKVNEMTEFSMGIANEFGFGDELKHLNKMLC